MSTHPSLGMNLQVSCFCSRRRVRIPLGFLVAQLVNNPPAMRKTWVQSPGWEDPLEKGMAAHSSILAWRIPWTL